MHKTQQKILNLARNKNLANLTLRKIAELIGESGSPQKIKHHLEKLKEKGLLIQSIDGQEIKPMSSSNIDKTTKLISLPIYGSANCGQALELANNTIEEYLKVSKSILGEKLFKKIKDLFVLKAVGNSMNEANINNESIEDGDYVIIDRKQQNPGNGDYVVSIIDGAANVKKFFFDKSNKQVILASESYSDIPPIHIHEDDLNDYSVCGKVVKVMKKPRNFIGWENTSAMDTLKVLGKQSKKESNYYENL